MPVGRPCTSFGCEECRNHFLEMYDACRYGRCDADADASLWLWRAHNVVNARTHGHVEDGYITSNTPNNAAAFGPSRPPERARDSPLTERNGIWTASALF